MTVAFLDSSALVKRYVLEENSERLQELLARTDQLLVSALCIPEVTSALNRMKRDKQINVAQYRQIKQWFTLDLNSSAICGITEAVLAQSVELLESLTLKTLDSIHLATAFLEQPTLFVSADRQQIKAARHLGLECIQL